MGFEILFWSAALACLAGWIAHRIEKWYREWVNRDWQRKQVPLKPAAKHTQIENVGGTRIEPSPFRESTVARTPTPTVSPKKSDEVVSISPGIKARFVAPLIANIQIQQQMHVVSGIEARFEEWRGEGADKYPPDWRFRTAEVRRRDGDRCQVMGCPRLGELHVHHLRAIKNGGDHSLSNLITLCEFHHALMPDHLEAIGEDIDSDRYSVRSGFVRRNQVQPGSHYVRPAVVRRRLGDANSIHDLLVMHQWQCPNCETRSFQCEQRQHQKGWADRYESGATASFAWRLNCDDCGRAWYLPEDLAEELGLLLGHIFNQPSNSKLIEYEKVWLNDLPYLEAPPCPRHNIDCLGHLIWKRNGNDGSIFRSCSMYFKLAVEAGFSISMPCS